MTLTSASKSSSCSSEQHQASPELAISQLGNFDLKPVPVTDIKSTLSLPKPTWASPEQFGPSYTTTLTDFPIKIQQEVTSIFDSANAAVNKAILSGEMPACLLLSLMAKLRGWTEKLEDVIPTVLEAYEAQQGRAETSKVVRDEVVAGALEDDRAVIVVGENFGFVDEVERLRDVGAGWDEVLRVEQLWALPVEMGGTRRKKGKILQVLEQDVEAKLTEITPTIVVGEGRSAESVIDIPRPSPLPSLAFLLHLVKMKELTAVNELKIDDEVIDFNETAPPHNTPDGFGEEQEEYQDAQEAHSLCESPEEEQGPGPDSPIPEPSRPTFESSRFGRLTGGRDWSKLRESRTASAPALLEPGPTAPTPEFPITISLNRRRERLRESRAALPPLGFDQPPETPIPELPNNLTSLTGGRDWGKLRESRTAPAPPPPELSPTPPAGGPNIKKILRERAAPSVKLPGTSLGLQTSRYATISPATGNPQLIPTSLNHCAAPSLPLLQPLDASLGATSSKYATKSTITPGASRTPPPTGEDPGSNAEVFGSWGLMQRRQRSTSPWDIHISDKVAQETSNVEAATTGTNLAVLHDSWGGEPKQPPSSKQTWGSKEKEKEEEKGKARWEEQDDWRSGLRSESPAVVVADADNIKYQNQDWEEIPTAPAQVEVEMEEPDINFAEKSAPDLPNDLAMDVTPVDNRSNSWTLYQFKAPAPRAGLAPRAQAQDSGDYRDDCWGLGWRLPPPPVPKAEEKSKQLARNSRLKDLCLDAPTEDSGSGNDGWGSGWGLPPPPPAASIQSKPPAPVRKSRLQHLWENLDRRESSSSSKFIAIPSAHLSQNLTPPGPNPWAWDCTYQDQDLGLDPPQGPWHLQNVGEYERLCRRSSEEREVDLEREPEREQEEEADQGPEVEPEDIDAYDPWSLQDEYNQLMFVEPKAAETSTTHFQRQYQDQSQTPYQSQSQYQCLVINTPPHSFEAPAPLPPSTLALRPKLTISTSLDPSAPSFVPSFMSMPVPAAAVVTTASTSTAPPLQAFTISIQTLESTTPVESRSPTTPTFATTPQQDEELLISFSSSSSPPPPPSEATEEEPSLVDLGPYTGIQATSTDLDALEFGLFQLSELTLGAEEELRIEARARHEQRQDSSLLIDFGEV